MPGRKLQLMTTMAVRELLQSTDHVLAVEDFDDVLALDAIACRIVDPADDVERNLFGLPTFAGDTDVAIHPPSMSVIVWYEETAAAWFAGDPEMADLAMVYALAQGRDARPLYEIPDSRTLRKTIRKWLRTIKATSSELSVAVRRVLGPSQDAEIDIDAEPVENALGSFGPAIALLCREYGGTPDVWMFNTPIATSNSLITRHLQRMDEEAMAKWRAAGGGKVGAPPVTFEARQHLAFDKRKKKIGASWLASK